jgi:hypothetical protein
MEIHLRGYRSRFGACLDRHREAATRPRRSRQPGLPRSLRSLAMTEKGEGTKHAQPRPSERTGRPKETAAGAGVSPLVSELHGLFGTSSTVENNAWRFRCSGSVAAYQRGRRTASAAAHPFATGPDLIPGRPAPAACGLEGQAPRPTGSSRPRDRRKARENITGTLS